MIDEKVSRVLERIGLSRNEIMIYLVLTKTGQAKAGKIAKLAGIDRSSCYNSLKSLVEKALVSYVSIGNIKWFSATEPKEIVEYVKAQEEDAKSILPTLEKLRNMPICEGQVRLFKGFKGVKAVMLDIIATGKDNYVLGSGGQFVKSYPDFAWVHNRMKKEKKIHTKVILTKKGIKEPFMTQGEYRYYEGLEDSPAVTNIYGEKVAIFIYTDEPEVVLIENSDVSKAYKSYFDLIWNVSSQLKT